MKKLALALSILTIAFAGSAFAQDTNNLGVYLANGDHFATADVGTTLELHVVVDNMTSPALAGFEFKLESEGPLLIIEGSVVYPTDAINAATRAHEFVVGFDGPVPAVDGAVEVMVINAIVSDAALPGSVFLRPVYFASISSVPSYLADASTGELVEMHQSTGGANDAVFVVNSDEIPVATDSTTFDSLKSLYR